MLTECIDDLENKGMIYELIIVNDCSKDKTSEIVSSFFNYKGKEVDIKIVELNKNRGKGGAVRIGALLAVGEVVLMADADGATTFH